MTNPTVGRGPLGGAAMAPTARTAGRCLCAKTGPRRRRAVGRDLRDQGGGRYLLDGGAGATRVILEAASVVAGGIRRREVLVDGFRFVVEVESERIAALRERASRGRASSAHGGPAAGQGHHPG